MFNIPVISNTCRAAPNTSGMMHLNALNGSSPAACRSGESSSTPSSFAPSSSSSPSPSCLPSYDEVVSNGQLFGLFSLNGGDTSCARYHPQPHHPHHRHHHHHHHHPQSQQQDPDPTSIRYELTSNDRVHIPQSHIGPDQDTGGYSSHQRLSTPTRAAAHAQKLSGSDVEYPGTAKSSPRSSKCRDDSDSADGLDVDVEEQCVSLSRISIVSDSVLPPITNLSVPPDQERQVSRRQESKIQNRKKRRHILCACASLLLVLAVLVVIVLLISGLHQSKTIKGKNTTTTTTTATPTATTLRSAASKDLRHRERLIRSRNSVFCWMFSRLGLSLSV